MWRSLDWENNNNRESRWWKDLRSICKRKCNDIDSFNENCTWRVRKGNKILFWEDYWVGKKLVKEAYPRLYSNPVQK